MIAIEDCAGTSHARGIGYSLSSQGFSDTPRLASYDAVVVGSGPNGLAAAIYLAREGLSMALFESEGTIGGGMRSKELTLPGCVHDVCSAVHPLAVSSPFFRSLPLKDFGLEWVHPPAPLAHPLDNGTVALMERSVEETAEGLGRDGDAYRRLMSPLAANADKLIRDVLGPLRIPRFPLPLLRFGVKAIRSAQGCAGDSLREIRPEPCLQATRRIRCCRWSRP